MAPRTYRQKRRIQRLFEDALDESSMTEDGAARLEERSEEFKACIKAAFARFTAEPPEPIEPPEPSLTPRELLGDDFISHEEVARARDLTYNAKQIAELEETLPDQAVLAWLQRNKYMLVAGPPRRMSIIDIRELGQTPFRTREGTRWHLEPKDLWANDDTVACRWLMLRKEPVPGSTDMTWNEQLKLLSHVEVVPNAAEQVWGMTTYKAVRGVYLFHDVYVRTSSLDTGGRRVFIGEFGVEGLLVDRWFAGRVQDNFIGVSSARK